MSYTTRLCLRFCNSFLMDKKTVWRRALRSGLQARRHDPSRFLVKRLVTDWCSCTLPMLATVQPRVYRGIGFTGRDIVRRQSRLSLFVGHLLYASDVHLKKLHFGRDCDIGTWFSFGQSDEAEMVQTVVIAVYLRHRESICHRTAHGAAPLNAPCKRHPLAWPEDDGHQSPPMRAHRSAMPGPGPSPSGAGAVFSCTSDTSHCM